ncbi:MAG: type VI secretion system baseplate subunit TssE [Deltaproteobacteria bacterium]|nr:MAG: type VI secretion system baseplate subunit TssE [Deltaproteobacteria bacterium]
MREERLLERIRNWKKHPERRAKQDPKRLTDSVLNHLQKILNTRHGTVPIAEDFGIPDFTEFANNYPDSLRGIERAIRNTILRYEPRLKAVRVNFLPQEEDVLTLRFQIIAKIATDEINLPVMFESIVDSEGKIKLRG